MPRLRSPEEKMYIFKYRPYLSIEAIKRILERTPRDTDNTNREIVKALIAITAKVDAGIQNPAYAANAVIVETMTEKLGFTKEEITTETAAKEFEKLRNELLGSEIPKS